MKTMRSRWCLLIAPVLAIILESLPFGVVMYFLNMEGPDFRRTFSYFDLISVGYGHFGPILTAIFSCVLLALAILYTIFLRKGIRKAIFAFSLLAVIASLTPLLSGLRSFSLINAVVTILLLLEVGISRFFVAD